MIISIFYIKIKYFYIIILSIYYIRLKTKLLETKRAYKYSQAFFYLLKYGCQLRKPTNKNSDYGVMNSSGRWEFKNSEPPFTPYTSTFKELTIK